MTTYEGQLRHYIAHAAPPMDREWLGGLLDGALRNRGKEAGSMGTAPVTVPRAVHPTALVEKPDGTRTFADRGLADEMAALFDRTDKGAAGIHFGVGVSGDPGKPPVMESWLAIHTKGGWSIAAPIKYEWKGPWSFGIQAGKSF